VTTRLKRIATLQSECSSNDMRPYVALEHLESWTGKLIEGTELPMRKPASTGMATAEPGDVLFGKLRPYLAKSWAVHQPVLASTELVCMRPHTQLNARWLGYLASSVPFVEWTTATSDGAKMPRTNWEKMGLYELSLPSLSEQRAIADYLDTETARIDTLISKKRHLIDLLVERRTALITQTVTRGLDPSPRLRPSNIDWLGDIPEHWDVSQLRRFVKSVKTGSTPASTELKSVVGDDIAWLSPGDIGSVLQMKQPSRTLAKMAVDNGLVPVFPAESTLIVGIGATTGRVGHSSKLSTGNQQLTCIVASDRIFPRFLSWQLWAHAKEIRAMVPYTTLPILTNEFLLSLSFAVPSLKEQQEIADYLDAESARIDALSSRAMAVIKLLEEYRTALISAAVTGQISIEA